MNTKHSTLDLSTMMARVVLAVLVALTITLLGLWLRASDALGFVSTMLAVSLSQTIRVTLRGDRIGAPTAASTRLQPLVDALAEYPGGKLLGGVRFKRGITAFGIGLAVAIGSTIVEVILFSHLPMAPVWRGTLALVIVTLPVHALVAWSQSRQEYTGSKFATTMVDALTKVLNPESESAAESTWTRLPAKARVAIIAAAHTLATAIDRVIIHLAIPAIFSTPLSIAAVAVGVITWIAGAPVFAALARSMTTPETVKES